MTTKLKVVFAKLRWTYQVGFTNFVLRFIRTVLYYIYITAIDEVKY